MHITTVVSAQFQPLPFDFTSVADPHHSDTDPDPACHFDADSVPACLFDADPDPSFPIKLEKALKKAHFPYILACHLQIDADPDPACHFDAVPDADPTFQFDADPCVSMRIRIHNAVLDILFWGKCFNTPREREQGLIF